MKTFSYTSIFAETLTVTLMVTLMAGCLEQSPSPNQGASTDVGTRANRIVAPLSLSVGTLYEVLDKDTDAGQIVIHKSCEVPVGTSDGSNTECRAQIPEGQLFYSKLILSLTADPKIQCDKISFQPYYYMASDQNGFLPNWATAKVDCFGPAATPNVRYTQFSQIPKDCFNGPAKSIFGDFPIHTAQYHLISEESHKTYEIPSGNSIKAYNPANNRFASNSLVVNLRSSPLTFSPVAGVVRDGYVANTFRDYQFQCLDKYEEKQFSLTLIIEELDRAPGESGANNIEGWEAAQSN